MTMEKTKAFVQRDYLIWGPLLLLCAFAIGMSAGASPDVLFVALCGLYLSAKWQIRGFCYALALLVVGAVGRHWLFIEDHLFQLGVEGSLACSFFITALSFEENAQHAEHLKAQSQNSQSALSSLEEEFAKTQEEFQQEKIATQEKIAALHKELDEMQTEHSSILILNEVLRKTTARHIQENQELTLRLAGAEKQSNLLKEENENLQRQMDRQMYSDPYAEDNQRLLQELNTARLELEQVRLYQDTFIRQHTIAALKAKEAESEAEQLQQRLNDLLKNQTDTSNLQIEVEQLRAQLEEKELQLQKEIFQSTQQVEELTEKLEALHKSSYLEQEALMQKAERALEEVEHLQTRLQEMEEGSSVAQAFEQKALYALEEVEQLQGLLREKEEQIADLLTFEGKVAQASEEIARQQTLLKEKEEEITRLLEREALRASQPLEVVSQKEDVFESKYLTAQKEIARLETKIRETQFVIERLSLGYDDRKLHEMEAKYKQLRNQFEERNEILHKTRSELFYKDTELQKIKIEQKALLLESLPRDAEKELHRLGSEVLSLEEENRHLQDLVTLLQDVKKK